MCEIVLFDHMMQATSSPIFPFSLVLSLISYSPQWIPVKRILKCIILAGYYCTYSLFMCQDKNKGDLVSSGTWMNESILRCIIVLKAWFVRQKQQKNSASRLLSFSSGHTACYTKARHNFPQFFQLSLFLFLLYHYVSSFECSRYLVWLYFF